MRKFIGVTALGIALISLGSLANNATAAERVTRTITQTREATSETHYDRNREYRNEQSLRDDINARLFSLSAAIRGLNQNYSVSGVQNSAGTASVGGSYYAAPARTRTVSDRRMMMLDRSDAVVSVPGSRNQTTVQEGSFTRTTYTDGSAIIELH
jgi:hypothetical protein